MRADRARWCRVQADPGPSLELAMTALVHQKLAPHVREPVLRSSQRYGGREAAALGLVDEASGAKALFRRSLARVVPLAGKDRATYGALKRSLHRRALSVLEPHAGHGSGQRPVPSSRAGTADLFADRKQEPPRFMEMHFATVWESIADAIGDNPALVCGTRRVTWQQWDERAARLAAAFADAGLAPDAKVGLYLYNGCEYSEVQFGAFKGRHVPININYRYLDDELLYLLDNSDAEALVFHTSLSDRVARVMDRCPKIRLWIQVDDGGESIAGAASYEKLLASYEPAPRIRRSEDDVYMLYTGGTTGMPKGVMYNMGGMVQSFIGSIFPVLGLGMPQEAAAIAPAVAQAWKEERGAVSIPGCPMMHGTGGWIGTMMPHTAGGTVVALEGRSLDAHELWATAQREKAMLLVIVGDAFAKPMLRTLEEARQAGRPYDTSSIRFIVSSGVMWTAEVKQQLLEWQDFILIDAMGSTEGTMGTQITTRGNIGATAKFAMAPTTKVFTEDERLVEPGSGEAGMVAAGGNVPIGYYKDEAKSRTTFKTIGGVRYSFPGDWAIVEADGSLTLLGRGSQCINSAGEKIYPEEVEEAVKLHPDVVDCLVVGVPDEKFGERVTAVASLAPGATASAQDVRDFTRTKIAAYKVPKQLFLAEEVRRAVNGKADYKWARQYVQDHGADAGA
jgi:fatty-acyl-CoA synthase